MLGDAESMIDYANIFRWCHSSISVGNCAIVFRAEIEILKLVVFSCGFDGEHV